MKKAIVIAVVLCLALGGLVFAQAPKPEVKQSAPAAKPIILTITGIIVKDGQNYIIQGQRPAELFTILNPNPSVLDSLVKSGKTVTIEAVSVVGDNVNIQKVDGKPYKEAKAAKAKAK